MCYMWDHLNISGPFVIRILGLNVLKLGIMQICFVLGEYRPDVLIEDER